MDMKQCMSMARVDGNVRDEDSSLRRGCVWSVESKGSVQCCEVSECVWLLIAVQENELGG